MEKRRILIEVEVEEIESLDGAYGIDPKMLYEITPVDFELEGNIELVCRKSMIRSKLARLDKTGISTSQGSSTRKIYEEPEQEASDLLRDASDKLLSGLGRPVINTIIDSLEEIIMPNRVREKNRNR